MAKKTETKTEIIEREYIIPLRRQWHKVPKYRRAPKATRAIREFLVRHMKIRDRDLKKIKLDKYLNQALWLRGIKKPPAKIRVKAIKEGEIVRVELVNMPEKIKYRKQKQEKLVETSDKKKPKKIIEQEVKPEEKTEEKKEEEEKKSSVVEAGKELEKTAAKQMKHQVKTDAKQPKRQQRVALQK